MLWVPVLRPFEMTAELDTLDTEPEYVDKLTFTSVPIFREELVGPEAAGELTLLT